MKLRGLINISNDLIRNQKVFTEQNDGNRPRYLHAEGKA